MFPAASVGATDSVKGCVMPGSPAVPRNSAYSDQRNAALVPTEIRVSIVAAPWRRLVHAARWNGQAPHTTTGAASARLAHCQYVNWSAGTIAIAMTGTESTTAPTRRCRSDVQLGVGVVRLVRRRDVGVLDAGKLGGVPRLLDLGDERGRVDARRDGDLRLLRRVVHGGGDALEAVELLLDPHGARGAGHPTDLELHERPRGRGGRCCHEVLLPARRRAAGLTGDQWSCDAGP